MCAVRDGSGGARPDRRLPVVSWERGDRDPSRLCDQDGELLAVLERTDWRRITARRRGEIAGEMLCVCEAIDVGIAEAWRADQRRFVIGYLHPSVPVSVR